MKRGRHRAGTSVILRRSSVWRFCVEAGFFMSSCGRCHVCLCRKFRQPGQSPFSNLKSNGDLTPVETTAVPGPAKPGGSLPLAVSPDKKRLFVGLRNEPYSVVTFTIDAKTGKLTPAGPRSARRFHGLYRHRPHRKVSAQRLLWRQQGHGQSDRADGVVQAAQQTMPTQPNAHCILTDPSNRYVLHTSLGGDLVYSAEIRRQDRQADAERSADRQRQGQGRPAPPRVRAEREVRLSAQRTRRLDLCLPVGCARPAP